MWNELFILTTTTFIVIVFDVRLSNDGDYVV